MFHIGWSKLCGNWIETMKSGKISRTALEVGLQVIRLNQNPRWKTRLPAGSAELSERLILAAGIFGFGPQTIRLQKNPWMARFSDFYEYVTPSALQGLGQRKIFMNEQVLAAIEADASQVLVVGAGFDTLCLRLAPQFPKVQFFEVDHPATSAAKTKGVDREGPPDNLSLIAADLNEISLSELMRSTGNWDCKALAAVVAEGLFLYLEEEVVQEIFEEVSSCTGLHTRFVFSYGVGIEQRRIERALLYVLGEPWLSWCDSEGLSEYMGPGWSVIEVREPQSSRELEGFAVAECLGPRPWL